MIRFANIENWVFDLDNTLYPPECGLFLQIDQRMGAFISEFLQVDRKQARAIQKKYFCNYGTTLNGLMEVHGMEPETYLDYVHDIDHSPIIPDPVLGDALGQLNGRKIVFTNGTISHAQAVLDQLGISDHFDEVHDIAASNYAPKPHRITYERLIKATNIKPEQSVMFEDIARNLLIPHEMGMVTVLVQGKGVHPDEELGLTGSGDEDHVHHVTDDLAGFLKAAGTGHSDL